MSKPSNTIPEHPLYKRLPVIPGDHAYNIAVAALGLVIDKDPHVLLALRDHALGGEVVKVPIEALVELFDVISDELGNDVLGFLVKDATGVQPTGALHKPKGLRFPSPGEELPEPEQDPQSYSPYGTNPNFW